MAKSRYSQTEIIDNNHYATWKLPVKSLGLVERRLLDGIQTVEYIVKVGDRIDHLSAKFYNEDQYWWVIALVNDINYPFASGGFIPGRVLRVPVSVKDVLDKLFP